MAALSRKVLARCADYNGHENVLFMMADTDFRLAHPVLSKNYTILDRAPRLKGKVLTTNQGSFKVCPDWSLTTL